MLVKGHTVTKLATPLALFRVVVQNENIVIMIRPDSGCAQVNFALFAKNKVFKHDKKPY